MSRFVLYGLTPLAVGVARALDPDKNRVILVCPYVDPDMLHRLPDKVDVVAAPDPTPALEQYLEGAESFLVLDEEDRVNLRIALLAHRLKPEVPVVLRTFDPTLADALEEGANIRRAYSLSALAAPAFVSALLADEVLSSLSLGGEQILLVRFRVEEPFAGLTLEELERSTECRVLASPGDRLEKGHSVVLAGLLLKVLGAAARNHPLPAARRKRRSRKRERTSSATMIGLAARSLVAVLVLAVVVFSLALSLPLIDAFYFVVTTATTTGYGDISLKDAPWWLKLFGCLVMVCGGGLVAILFSHLSALVTADRIEERMGRRAADLTNHVVLAGLGRIGYRVERLLAALGIACVVVDSVGGRFFQSASRQGSIVLQGDARLAGDLEKAGVADARAMLACTDDDLSNLQSTLQARRLNPKIYTVARIVDSDLAQSLGNAFKLDAVINPVAVAISAFVGAATDERAIRRFPLDGAPHLAFRLVLEDELTAERRSVWESDRLRVLAVETGGAVRLPRAEESYPAGTHVIVCGPVSAMEKHLHES